VLIVLNKFAKQADCSVMISQKDTYLLTTAVASKRENDLDFFPLVINYEEKLYSSGKIPANFSRREGRPLDAATLNARLIDRTLRPLFPEEYKQEVQIVVSENIQESTVATQIEKTVEVEKINGETQVHIITKTTDANGHTETQKETLTGDKAEQFIRENHKV